MARILVVNDETELLEVCQMVLELKGHQVRTCASHDGLHKLVQDHRPDLVVLDWVVGNGTSDEVLPMVRREAPDAPILIITGTPEVEDEARRLGASSLLPKPFDVATFTGEVARLLRHREQEQQQSATSRAT